MAVSLMAHICAASRAAHPQSVGSECGGASLAATIARPPTCNVQPHRSTRSRQRRLASATVLEPGGDMGSAQSRERSGAPPRRTGRIWPSPSRCRSSRRRSMPSASSGRHAAARCGLRRRARTRARSAARRGRHRTRRLRWAARNRSRAPAGSRPARGRPRGTALRRRQLRRRHRLQLRAVRERPDGGAARDQARRGRRRASRRRDLGHGRAVRDASRAGRDRLAPSAASARRRRAFALAAPGALEAPRRERRADARDARSTCRRRTRTPMWRPRCARTSRPARRDERSRRPDSTRRSRRTRPRLRGGRRTDGSVTFDNVFKVLVARA